ncbi:MAG: DctP family TRAP transporter solute-binding subunit [Duodenibacillus sp.]|nr:DctP family TRAP transporter solute-binding subunit [Duodenibacillus sp.]
MRLSQAFCAVAVASAMAFASAASAADATVTYRMAYHLPTKHALSIAAEKFAKVVGERTNGSVKIITYPAGQLYTDKTMNDAIMTGGVDMGLNTVGRWATIIPAMEVFDVPFLFPSYKKVDAAIDGPVGQKLTAELLKKGVRPVYWADYGFVQFGNNKKAIKTPADFKGLKLRGYGEMPSQTIKALGASPVTMGAAEVYMAIQRGVIDGQTSGQTAMLQRKMYEVHKYLTVTNHAFPEFILAMNERSYKKMSEEQRKVFDAAAAEIRDEMRSNAQAEDARCIEELKKKGMDVYVVPEADLKQWQDATKVCYEIFAKRAGKLGQELVDICTK